MSTPTGQYEDGATDAARTTLGLECYDVEDEEDPIEEDESSREE